MSNRQTSHLSSTLSQEQLLSLLKTKALILLVTENFNLLSKEHCLVSPIRIRKPTVQMDETERSRKIETYRSYASQCIDIIARLDEEHLSKAAELNNAVITELIDNSILGSLISSGIELKELEALLQKLSATK